MINLDLGSEERLLQLPSIKTNAQTNTKRDIKMSNLVIQNSCKNKIKSKLDIEKVITKILKKIPSQYKIGIGGINILYSSKSNSQGVFIKNVTLKNQALNIININMANSDYSGTPFFSILFLNLHFIDIISKNYNLVTGKKIKKGMTFDWIYLGCWQPINIIIKTNYYLTKKNKLIAKINKIIDKLLFKIAGG